MPDQPEPKVHPHPARKAQGSDCDSELGEEIEDAFRGSSLRAEQIAARAAAEQGPEYAELSALSNFSFLRGASHPEELVREAASLGYRALALTDEHSLAGVVRAHAEAKELDFSLLIGAEIRPVDSAPLVLLAPDRAAYGRLSRLVSLGRRRGDKKEARLATRDLDRFREGLIAIAFPDARKLGPRSTRSELEQLESALNPLREIYGDAMSLAAFMPEGEDDDASLRRMEILESRLKSPLVAIGAIEAHVEARRPLRDVLAAIRRRSRVSEIAPALAPLRFLRSRSELSRRYSARPDLLTRTVEIAAQCRFSLDELRYEYPDEATGRDLRALVREHEPQRWPEGTPEKVQRAIQHELGLIAEMRYESYFLTVYDLVRFARSRGILCQGRGSAANSAVCYCLGITNVDPAHFELLFERFVSKDRNEPPDIDVDFEHERREEVLQYVYERYGRHRAALAATVISYRGRSAVRDVGKALGLTLDQVERLSKSIRDRYHDGQFNEERIREAGLDFQDARVQQVIALTQELRGFPRHLSQHVGGMVMTQGRLDEIVPIENAAMDGRTVIQWDKDDLSALGLLKVDCLALGMLTAIRKTFDLIADYRGQRWTLATLPEESPSVYEMAGRGDTVGVFQIESRAQMAMLPRFLPRRFYDLVIEVAIVRPGPIQGGMVHPYLKRRAGKEAVSYPSEEVRGVLKRTLGVPIFQEQVMQLAVVAAGFTPGEADQLRRAMAAWRRSGTIEVFRDKLLTGMAERGYAPEFAEALYRQIRGFGEYGFPESHAASFAHLTYVSLWLKRFEPAAFCCGLLNSLPMGFYGPAQLVADARRHGVEVKPVDVVDSDWDCRLEAPSTAKNSSSESTAPAADEAPSYPPLRELPQLEARHYGRGGPALRLGLRLQKGLSEAKAQALMAARKVRPFQSVEDCVRRAGLDHREARKLAESGAFASLSDHRREAYWRAGAPREERPLFENAALEEGKPVLAAPSDREIVLADYRHRGLSLHRHPAALIRDRLRRLRILGSADLRHQEHGWPVAVAGVCICRQMPATASGIMFVTLEDENGFLNIIVRKRTQERFRIPLLGASFLIVKGSLERVDGVTHIMAAYLEDAGALLAGLPTSSRDFH